MTAPHTLFRSAELTSQLEPLMPSRSQRLSWTDKEIHRRLREAVKRLWSMRAAQTAKQQTSGGTVDAGARSSVTGGQHMNGFVEILADVARMAGFTGAEIRTGSGIEIAGFYRPNKKWDLVVVRDNRLCAAVELKSMAGSYGNNLNNRTEEALGSATDVWAAFRKGTLGTHQPWLGYWFVIRREPGSTRPVRIQETVPAVDPAFPGTSYVQRYELLCRRMVLERVYHAAAFLATPKGSRGGYTEPSADLGAASFMRGLYGHLIGCV